VGVFFEPSGTKPSVREVLIDALGSPPVVNADAEATHRLANVDGGSLQTSRLIIAIVLVALLLMAGVFTDIKGYDDSSKALFGLAATLFGVIVGLLGGEKPST
jgi:hypothetical protein